MPKIIKKEEVKFKIAQSAFNVFINKGYEETRIIDIAQDCNMSRTSIYQYFNNKDEILCYNLNYHLDDIARLYKKVLRKRTLDELEKIEEIIKAIFNQYYNKKNVLELYVTYWLRQKFVKLGIITELQNRTERLKYIFASLLKKGVQKGIIKDINIESMSQTLFLLVRGHIIQSSVYENVTPTELIESTLFLLQGLRK